MNETKNKHSIEQVEQALNDADEYAESNSERLTHEEVFDRLREKLNQKSD